MQHGYLMLELILTPMPIPSFSLLYVLHFSCNAGKSEGPGDKVARTIHVSMIVYIIIITSKMRYADVHFQCEHMYWIMEYIMVEHHV